VRLSLGSRGMTQPGMHGQSVALGGLLHDREYVALSGAGLLSAVGDQICRVALSVLVYSRTGSPFLTALVYAATYLPAVLGGPLLCGLADRLPRRRVLIGIDLSRAALLALMAVPGMPLGILLGLLLCSSALEAPFSAARASLMRNVLREDDDRYRVGVGVDQTLQQTAQVLGFVGGGLLLIAVPPTGGLLINAGTFALSAALLMTCVRGRAAAVSSEHDTGADARDDGRAAPRRRSLLRTALADARTGLRAATATAARRRAVLLTWVGVAVMIVPEAVAAPWAHALGAGSGGLGLLLGAGPAGAVAGLVVVTRFAPGRGDTWLAPLALLAMAPLTVCAFSSSLPLLVGLLALSGAAGAYVTLAQIAFVSAVDDASRGRAFGIAASGVTVAQGLGIAAAGAFTELLAPPVTVGLAGTAGLLAVAVVAVRTRPRRPAPVHVVDLTDPLPEQRPAVDVVVAAGTGAAT
jgi:MFS family permease